MNPEDREVIVDLLEQAIVNDRQRLNRAKLNAWQTVPILRARAEHYEDVLSRFNEEGHATYAP